METEIWLIVVFFVLLIALLGSVLGLLIHSGLFAPVDIKVKKPPIGKVVIAYKDGRGPYKECGANFSEATSIAPEKKQIGLYYDPPDKVAAEKLRWAVGTIIAEGDEEVDPQLKAAYAKEKYLFMELPSIDACVYCEFPHTTMVSILLAIFRVYPEANRFVEGKKLEAYPWMELYYDGKIHFVAPLSKQKKFFTESALKDEKSEAGTDNTTEEEQKTEECSYAQETKETSGTQSSVTVDKSESQIPAQSTNETSEAPDKSYAAATKEEPAERGPTDTERSDEQTGLPIQVSPTKTAELSPGKPDLSTDKPQPLEEETPSKPDKAVDTLGLTTEKKAANLSTSNPTMPTETSNVPISNPKVSKDTPNLPTNKTDMPASSSDLPIHHTEEPGDKAKILSTHGPASSEGEDSDVSSDDSFEKVEVDDALKAASKEE